MSIFIIEAFIKMRQTLQLMSLNVNNQKLLPELLKQYNHIVKKLESQSEKLNKHDNEINDLKKMINVIIKKMLPDTKELKIKGFQAPPKK